MSNMNDESRDALALANAGPRPVGRVGIIGANTMGAGIANKLLEAGIPVTLFDLGRAALDRAMAPVRPADRRMALLAVTVNFHHLKDCDLIIEAVCTDMAGKEKLFRRLDQTAKPGAILMTLASRGGVDRVAGCTRRSGEVLGLHCTGSADAGGTWELVCGKGTSAQALATAIAFAPMFHGVAPVPDGDAWRVDLILE
jgi:3-hydroxyacyl-CoA dehydrogenase